MSQFFSRLGQSIRNALSADNQEAVEEVIKLEQDEKCNRFAERQGLAIQTVSWEDTARLKNSCWGPNISDMTLALSQGKDTDCTYLPMIRKPNFADVTTDIPINQFSVTVGNERAQTELRRISLKQYLTDASVYLFPSGATDVHSGHFHGKVKDLFVDKKDQNILCSSQFCILPLSKGKCEFNVSLFNYQSTRDNPAVLVIVASAQGTSAQVIVDGQTALYFNRNGQAANFEAVRLEDDRKVRGKSNQSKQMDLEESENNVLFVYQVPLKVKRILYREEMQECIMIQEQCCMIEECNISSKKKNKSKRGMDNAQVRAGESHSDFVGVGSHTIERDDRFPIRCTMQYYKVTDSAAIPESAFVEMKNTIDKTLNAGVAFGSLVTQGQTARTTEPQLTNDQRTNRPLFSLLQPDQA